MTRGKDGPDVVLDAGALLALDRRDLRVILRIAEARARGRMLRIPAGALAQAWRDGKKQALLARLLKQGPEVVVLDELGARHVGAFLAHQRRGTNADVVDAQVALTALRYPSVVMTSDPDDIEALGVDQRRIFAV